MPFVAFFAVTALVAVCLLGAIAPEGRRGLVAWLLISITTAAACGIHLWGNS